MTKPGRELLAKLSDHLGYNTYLLDVCSNLERTAKQLHTAYEHECCTEGWDTNITTQRERRVDHWVCMLPDIDGVPFTYELGADPRGVPVVLQHPALESRYDNWERTGICVGAVR